MQKTTLKDLRIVDNFYQTSSFYPMPTTLIGTIDEKGLTSYGAYSLCFPYYVAGKDYYAMLLCCRNSSNTAKNIIRESKVCINFIPDHKKILKEVVRLGFPGDTPQEKMKDFNMTMVKGLAEGKGRPLIIEESYQVFECTWDRTLENAEDTLVKEEYEPPYKSFNGITSQHGAHFILKVDKILIKEKYEQAIINGVRPSAFPKVPIDYGYRDSKNFFFSKFKKPYAENIIGREVDVKTILYAGNRIDPEVKFTEDACAMLVKVPRVFITMVLKSCVKWAKENKVNVITSTEMKIINDKRSKEKGN